MPIRTVAAVTMLALWGVCPAGATTIGFVPSVSTFEVGHLFDVDVVVSGLSSTEVVSAYDLDVTYDDGVLSPSSVTFGSLLGTPPFGFSLEMPGGVLNVVQTSLLFDSELLALQGSSVALFTIRFEAHAAGTSLLGISRGANDIKGIESSTPFIPSILDVDVTEGRVDVVGVVAEPTTAAILALVVLGCALDRRRRDSRE